jgi:hypothetical protein
MSIQITIERRQFYFSSFEQTLAKGAVSRKALQSQFQSQLENKRVGYVLETPVFVRPETLKRMITKYSEQLVYRPLEELQYWFTYSSGAFLEPGYPPLFYSRNDHKAVSPSKSAVAGIGEGVAGFLGQRLYQARLLARPNHDYPDIVMVGNGKTYLLESKATTYPVQNVRQSLDEEIARIVVYTSSCNDLDTRPVVGVLVGTAVISETEYHCCITEISV